MGIADQPHPATGDGRRGADHVEIRVHAEDAARARTRTARLLDQLDLAGSVAAIAGVSIGAAAALDLAGSAALVGLVAASGLVAVGRALGQALSRRLERMPGELSRSLPVDAGLEELGRRLADQRVALEQLVVPDAADSPSHA